MTASVRASECHHAMIVTKRKLTNKLDKLGLIIPSTAGVHIVAWAGCQHCQ